MLPLRSLLVCSAFAVAVAIPGGSLPRLAKAAEEDWRPLFNGKDLAGWALVNTHSDTFFVKDGEIITNGNPMGFLRTDKQYENFVLEMDWMHINKKEVGNSGLFVWGDPLPATGTVYTRGIEVQILVNYPNVGWATNHGDLFSIWGAKCVPDRPHPKGYERCLPSEERCKGGGEWNHYKVTANDGSIKLEVNGKEVSGVSKCNPRKGYLALESEGAECHFKNIKIKELPSTNPKPEEIATVSAGHTSLFNGLDLKGWKTEKDWWKVTGGKLVATKNAWLQAEKTPEKCELIVDWKAPKDGMGWFGASLNGLNMSVSQRGAVGVNWDEDKSVITGLGKEVTLKPGGWNRSVFTFDGTNYTITVNGQNGGSWKPMQALAAKPVSLNAGEGMEIMNVFVRELKEK